MYAHCDLIVLCVGHVSDEHRLAADIKFGAAEKSEISPLSQYLYSSHNCSISCGICMSMPYNELAID